VAKAALVLWGFKEAQALVGPVTQPQAPTLMRPAPMGRTQAPATAPTDMAMGVGMGAATATEVEAVVVAMGAVVGTTRPSTHTSLATSALQLVVVAQRGTKGRKGTKGPWGPRGPRGQTELWALLARRLHGM
jgi:hypothetical protein